MFTKSEAFYDAIYGTMKDYEKEAQQIHAVIQQYLDAFRASGLDVVHDSDREKLTGRGLYIGVAR
jgi:hypothetical protein